MILSRVRQKTIKTIAKKIVVNYWDVIKEIWDKAEEMSLADPKLAADFRFEMYKRLVELTTDGATKKLRNRIAGYIVTLMKQILYLGKFTIEELATKYKLREEETPETKIMAPTKSGEAKQSELGAEGTKKE